MKHSQQGMMSDSSCYDKGLVLSLGKAARNFHCSPLEEVPKNAESDQRRAPLIFLFLVSVAATGLKFSNNKGSSHPLSV